MRDHIIDTAGRMFYSRGVRAVGVNEIVAEAGIAKATLYSHFEGKEQLVVAYLEARHALVLKSFRDGHPGPGATVRARVLRPFDTLQSKAESPEFRGCAFLLALAEHEDSAAIKAVVETHKRATQEAFLSELPVGLTERLLLSQQLALLYDGALAQIMIWRTTDVVRTAWLCAQTVLDKALATNPVDV